jgi:flagellar export protein FliJ
MPFRFRFKTLLRHREFRLREAQSALAAAQSLKMRIESRMNQLQEKIRVQTEQFEKEQETGIDAAMYFHFKNFLNFLERDLLLLQRDLAKACDEVDIRQQAVVESNKSVKVFENMESNEKEAYRFEQSKRERKILDDVAIFKNYRDRDPGGREGKS